MFHCGSDGGTGKDVMKSRKTIFDDAFTETKRIHETSGKHDSISGMIKTKNPLQRCDQFEMQRAGKGVFLD